MNSYGKRIDNLDFLKIVEPTAISRAKLGILLEPNSVQRECDVIGVHDGTIMHFDVFAEVELPNCRTDLIPGSRKPRFEFKRVCERIPLDKGFEGLVDQRRAVVARIVLGVNILDHRG